MIELDAPILDLSYSPENHNFPSSRLVVEKIYGFQMPDKLYISDTLNQLYVAEDIKDALEHWMRKYAILNLHLEIEVLQIGDSNFPIQMGNYPLYIMSMTTRPDFDFTVPLMGVREKKNMYFKMYRMKKFVY